MKNKTKKSLNVVSKSIQWLFTGLFAICALANGIHYSTFLLLLAAFLMTPITPIRVLFKKIKIKTWLLVIISVVLFFSAVASSPVTSPETSDRKNVEPHSDLLDNDVSSYNDTTVTDTTTATPETTRVPETTTTPPETTHSEPESSETTVTLLEETTPQNTTLPESTTSEPQTQISGVGSATASPVVPSTLPAYSGTPYTVVNNNVPNFSGSELTTTGYEKYSSLDNFGRCGVALASCGKEIMPNAGEERGSISSIKPTGWIQAKYNGISGGYLWNRCHLIGWQLSAENANRQNLITGTRYMNVNGMLPFENMVADYIHETNNHVAYRVTPIFEGNNLVCSGVQIEAFSIEDNGDGICFNVYCYNVQPGITINYTTGESTGPNAETSSTTTSAQDTAPVTDTETLTIITSEIDYSETMVWIPKSGSKYHTYSSCSNMKNPTQVTEEEAEAMGYEPCKRCH